VLSLVPLQPVSVTIIITIIKITNVSQAVSDS